MSTVNKDPRRNCLGDIHWSSVKPLTEEEYHRQFLARFWAMVKKGNPNECWEWQGSRAQNYGQLSFRWPNGARRPMRAHVASFLIHNGRLPAKGLCVCHTCDNPPCVNPAHLWEGTTKQNMRDAWRKGRMAACGTLKEFQPVKESALKLYLTSEQATILKTARKAKGDSIHDIGYFIGMDFTAYYRIEKGEHRGLSVEQVHFLLRYLSIDEQAFNIRSEQTYLFGTPKKNPQAKMHGGRFEQVARVHPKKASHRKIEGAVHSCWSKLPPVCTRFYRADLIRESLIKTRQPLSAVADETGIYYRKFKQVLNGEDLLPETVMTVAAYVGLSESDIFNTAQSQAA